MTRSGLAACPAHDVAFDPGMLTINGGLRIHLASSLADAVQNDPLARPYYGRPPLREVIPVRSGAQAPCRLSRWQATPRPQNLDRHRQKVFIL